MKIAHSALIKYGLANKSKLLWIPLLILILITGLIESTYLSLAQYRGFNMRYFDLGAMSQAVWSATQGRPLIFSGHGFEISRLARNMEVIYFLIAPIYRLFPSPETLLVLQSLLFVAAAVPLFFLTRRKIKNPYYSILVVLIYLLYPVAQTSVLFEFHGDALAMAFLLFAIEAADRRARNQYFIWIFLSLLCKWYVGIPVALLGLIIWLKWNKKVGLTTVIGGAFWSGFALLILLPLFAPAGSDAILARATVGTYIASRFAGLDFQATGILRLAHFVIVALPAVVVLGWRAPLWLIPASSVIAPALLSSGFGPAFSYRTHHYAVAVPFLMASIVYGAEKLYLLHQNARTSSEKRKTGWKGRIVLTFVVTLIFHAAFVDSPLNPRFFLSAEASGQGLDESRYGVSGRDKFKEQWLSENVPADLSVTAEDFLSTRLTNRRELYLTERPYSLPLAVVIQKSDLVVTDSLYDFVIGDPEDDQVIYGGIAHERFTIRRLLQDPEWKLTRIDDGLLLFSRDGEELEQSVTILPSAEQEILHSFDNKIGLVSAEIGELGNGSISLSLRWKRIAKDGRNLNLVAVSYLAGITYSHIAHLPSMALLPPNEWPEEAVIEEKIQFNLPRDASPGTYPLILGVYDANKASAVNLDSRSRVGTEILLGHIAIP